MIKPWPKTYRGVGSLTLSASGEVIVRRFIPPFKYLTLSANIPVVTTSAQMRLAQLDHLLRLVWEKRLDWDRRLVEDPNPIWSYANYLEARELVRGCEEMNREQPTYLRHLVDHDGQFLTQWNGQLSAILDFEL